MASSDMKQIHIWPNHIRIPHVDLVLPRQKEETLEHTLRTLNRYGFDTRAENVELYGVGSTNETGSSSTGN